MTWGVWFVLNMDIWENKPFFQKSIILFLSYLTKISMSNNWATLSSWLAATLPLSSDGYLSLATALLWISFLEILSVLLQRVLPLSPLMGVVQWSMALSVGVQPCERRFSVRLYLDRCPEHLSTQQQANYSLTLSKHDPMRGNTVFNNVTSHLSDIRFTSLTVSTSFLRKKSHFLGNWAFYCGSHWCSRTENC